jgi:hypothetical protein
MPAWLSELLQKTGWPLRSVVGAEASEAALAIAQHADHDQTFQARCLEFMRAAAGARDWELLPVEDPAHLNERRAAAGLPESPTGSSLPRDQAER